MDIITCDFETFYSKEFSLSKMQTDAYILDPQFEVIMVGIAVNDGPVEIYSGTETKEAFEQYDWENSAVRCHNTLFDGYILSEVYGIRPLLWMDTLAQGRMVNPHLPSHSLAALSKFYGLPAKGTAVHNMIGKRRAHMTIQELREYAEYCTHDVELCRALGNAMDPFTPMLEQTLIDMTIRMFTEPALVGDVDMMKSLYEEEIIRKQALIALVDVDKSVLMSNEKLAATMRSYGVTPPTKISARTGKTAYAFAKTDKDFIVLQDHDDPRIQGLVAARLGVKSTIAETRALRFWETAQRGPLPVYLNFWGAKTTGRYSGGNSCNWQNLPARGPSAGLRKAICAPPGHKLVVGDSSNIELRVAMVLAGQWDVVEKLAAGVDMYCDFAGKLFGRTITKEDKAERFLGKTAMLGLQYGAGAPKFQEMVRLAAAKTPGMEPISIEKAYDTVELYRSIHTEVVALWNHCGNVVIPDIANGCSLRNVDVNGMFITQKEGFGRPGEPGVVYHDLSYEPKEREWSYLMGRARVKLYGAKMVENLCQHAAMKIVMWQTARIHQKYPVRLSVHDEAVCVVPDSSVNKARLYMEDCMNLTPQWCRGIIPVACETGVGETYASAK